MWPHLAVPEQLADETGARPRVVVVSVAGRATFAAEDAEALERVADVRFLSRSEAMSPADAAAELGRADVVALTPKVSPELSPELLDALPRLRGIALYATGYDFVDVGMLRARGVRLSVLPDYSTRSVAEHTLALMLTLSRRVHLGHDRSRGLVPPTTSLRGFELGGRTLGVIGCGRIGGHVTRLAQGLGMDVLVHDVEPRPLPGTRQVGREELLASSDVVTLHCPMAYGAAPTVGADEVALMRRGSVLVNASRSALVDTAAVVAAVRTGHLRGYAVDDVVLEDPADADLLVEGRVVQTGHSAWWSDEVLARGRRMWARHVEALVLGHPLDEITEPNAAPLAAAR
ncbi:2-hydroxyacid dehydrogenase [Pseudokineococcus sp. 1T1Z-3]|uniref:2-hydroxyacid dehydrogenase n=1 Tax=Pseudokineococcus sp. 1T1Z-3 TaxID=3132745 RepID=UPI0030A3DEC2